MSEIKPTDLTARKLPELLAPAGSPAALEAAVAAGADAVYLGGTGFNARANAANFPPDALRDAVALAHSHGVRVYLTLNTLVYDRELRDFLRAAEEAYLAGADALIVADFGGAAALRRTFPDLPLHASTQMSGHNSAAAQVMAEAGFSRMVLARELSRENIASFVRNSPIEAEVFVHGALCVCHSGQCLFSSIVGGRSGNRGECAQPCRLPYGTPGGKNYPLSLKDLSLAQAVPELIEMGVASLKLEGRMKPADYVSAVVGVWRRLLDERRGATAEEMRYLADVFSRSGFTDGYYKNEISHTMLGVRTDADKARTAALRPRPLPVPAPREPVTLPERTCRAEGYVPVTPEQKRGKTRSALFNDPWQITPAAAKFFDISYIPLEKYSRAVRDGIAPRGVALPPVITDAEADEVRRMLAAAKKSGATDALLGNIGHLGFVREAGLIPHGDFRLNICNYETVAAYEKLGFADLILSPELTLPRIRDLRGNTRTIVYGRLPLMITEKCVGRECGGCKTCDAGKNVLTDRMGKKFPVLRVWRHRSMIVNCLPTYMGDKADALRDARITAEHWIFTNETPRECDSVIRAAAEGRAIPGGCRRIAAK